MSEAFSQRPIFDALERYLGPKELGRFLSLDKRIFYSFKDDMLVWYKLYKNNVRFLCKHGRIDVIKFMHQRQESLIVHGVWRHHDLVGTAAEYGQLDLLQWLHENKIGDRLYTDAMWTAVSNGHLKVVKWLHNNGIIDPLAMKMAVERGHFDIAKWLHKQKYSCDKSYITYAASHGNLKMVKLLHKNVTGWSHYPGEISAIDVAAKKGYLEIVKFLDQNNIYICTVDAMNWAAENGHLEIVKYLHENRNEGCNTWAMDSAARNGHLHIIKYLHKNRTEGCTQQAIIGAFKNGHIEIVKWLHYNRRETCMTHEMKNKIYKRLAILEPEINNDNFQNPHKIRRPHRF